MKLAETFNYCTACSDRIPREPKYFLDKFEFCSKNCLIQFQIKAYLLEVDKLLEQLVEQTND